MCDLDSDEWADKVTLHPLTIVEPVELASIRRPSQHVELSTGTSIVMRVGR